ncbi:Lrp/AsnC family transcriptional regulator [Rhodobacter capsulatus]|jgi:DNA-binding Lrp family transcriptional regulator|uniref:Transcriptional regulator, AsnC/Lrp family n=2 Tax=Rhodobacter capsulatus TaxID=1061 RepID=D5AV63_RHOCB|nr:Lrp/AsnC family transcriptional regulator [Rhodobacter capsulatus]AAC16136.1 potential regulatory protein [Rhodobacter capsulatus SB 1003]ADE85845.1 transcriptional regulator, AsnC/Lrp family [Rhodobacter capsulatus SB 1003]ETD01347.1 AsnC family transcriptional regulator [Rhodobacter capsulatus DE442]ETD76234.1 AsnC family transcriptional regulator [Rhodobacter capsulatus R121]ETD83989.1 AsnC family transcriptional regulator [Rhodobacter capsulatus YW1]
MTDLSATDRRIIAALRRNARMSITELAHAAQVSRTTAKLRLDTLLAEGRIRRFTIETDVDVEGEVRAITLVELQGKLSRQVIRTLTGLPEVSTVHATNGAWDLVVEIRTGSLVDFDRVLRAIREIPGVINSQSCLLLAHVAA